MSRLSKSLLIVIVILLAVVVVYGSQPQGDRIVRLTEQGGDCGSAVQLNQGNILELFVNRDPSSSYAWEASIRGPDQILDMGNAKYGPLSSIGASGLYLLQYRATIKAQSVLKLAYLPLSGKNRQPLKTCEVTVHVK
ncbi:MAG TPA: hypothetical protein VK206_16660 [Anaerolineales bacterium]|nr:hypothetical protein [Anaerolineales bacterium]HLO29602.1 hypothetical protein [Anaerolineales bacterium]